MKTEFMAAITQLSSERNLPKEVILDALEAALVSAYKKEVFSAEQDVAVKIDTVSGDIRVYLVKTVADPVTDTDKEISQADARKIRKDATSGDIVEIESTPKGAGRIAAQIARQVVLQRLREAEHHAAFEQFVGKEGEVVTGTVHFAQPNAVYVSLGRREAILPLSEQLPSERYHAGQQLKFYLLQASQEGRGPRVMLSRTHPNLVRRLFEIEIPEIHGGVVESGIRLQSVINHLNGEKIDVVEWDEDPTVFIANSLSPAQVVQISLDEGLRTATVIVPDKQLSLAIGRGGQNARLAAKLTGWRIDIKSSSAAEVDHTSVPDEAASADQEPEPKGETLQQLLDSEVFRFEDDSAKPGQSVLRFAEDILPRTRGGPRNDRGRSKGKKKKTYHEQPDEP
jgi:N utilization substance protein A